MAKVARRSATVAVPAPPAKPLLDDLVELAQKYPLTEHMKQRCNERGIGVFEVYATIAEPDSARRSNGTVVYQRGDIKVYVGDGDAIVTVADRFENSRSKPRVPLTPEQVAQRTPRSQALDEAWLFSKHTEPDTPRLMYVTPEVADKLLGNNTHNRPFSAPLAERYKLMMLAGEWRGSGPGGRLHATSEPIAIDWDQNLHDGQHRVWAIGKSGVGVWMYVCVGVDPANFSVIDTGRTRSYGDALAVAGFEKNRHVLGSISRMVYLALHKGFTTTYKVPIATVLEQFSADAEGIERAAVVGMRMEKGAACTRTGAAAAYYLIRRVNDPDVVDEFFFGLSTGVGLEETTDPRKKFRDLMVAELKRGKGKHRNGVEHLALIIKVWNAWVEGREVKVLSWRKGEQVPAPARAAKKED